MVAEAEDAVALWPDFARSALGYASCRVPVRIVCGTAGVVASGLTQGGPAAALIPSARLDRLSGMGQMLHDTRPDAVVEAVAALAEG